jgi:hypothetical protein
MTTTHQFKLLRVPENHYITHTLYHLLHSIGKTVDIVDAVNPVDDDNTSVLYIISFCQRVFRMPKRYIVYQLEQMHTDTYIDNAEYKAKLHGAIRCWEYNSSNMAHYSTPAPVWMPVPIAHMPSIFPCAVPDGLPTIDVLFYGSVNDRRYSILKSLYHTLQPMGIMVKLVQGHYGESLYPFIRRARVVLNIGFYDDTLLATYRLNEVLVHKRVVLSEMSTNETDANMMREYKRGGVMFIPPIDRSMSNIYHALIQPLVKMLTNGRQYAEHTRMGERFVLEKEVFFRRLLHNVLA